MSDARHVVVRGDDNDTAAEGLAMRGVSVNPNPFGVFLMEQHAEGVAEYELENGAGATMLDGKHDGVAEIRLLANGLPGGAYWLRLCAADGVCMLGVVKC